jgi:hypothetical protein
MPEGLGLTFVLIFKALHCSGRVGRFLHILLSNVGVERGKGGGEAVGTAPIDPLVNNASE